MKLRTFMTLASLLLTLATPKAAQADFFVVVNTTNPVKALSTKEAVDLYMGRSRAFPNGEFALPFDLARDGNVRMAFYRALTGLTAPQLNSYWSRLMFTGQVMPPQALPSEKAVIEMVRRNPSGIGYLSEEPQDRNLRVVLVLREPS